MRVGIAAYLLHSGRDYRAAGVSVYTHRLIEHLPAAAPSHCFLAFVGRDAPRLPVDVEVSPLPTWQPAIRILWEQMALPLLCRARGVDVLHGTVNALPFEARVPCVVTVHDLSFLRYPDRFRTARRLYQRVATTTSVRQAKHVIAVSEHTRRDLLELLAVPPERVSVVHSGIDSAFTTVPCETVEAFRQERLNGRRIILFVGTLEPRKNLDLLIRAFAAVRRELGIAHALVLAGARGWSFQQLFSLVEDLGLEDAVQFVDYVHPSELPLWYNAADLFAYPSAYEGFGLPVAEAMACGVPVITTAASALIEVAGDACLTVEPGSEEALRAGMTRLMSDEGLRRDLRERGLRRSARFSWKESARATARVYERAAGILT
jgi:glycosyltransferase involved in cell wall biosynthesis